MNNTTQTSKKQGIRFPNALLRLGINTSTNEKTEIYKFNDKPKHDENDLLRFHYLLGESSSKILFTAPELDALDNIYQSYLKYHNSSLMDLLKISSSINDNLSTLVRHPNETIYNWILNLEKYYPEDFWKCLIHFIGPTIINKSSLQYYASLLSHPINSYWKYAKTLDKLALEIFQKDNIHQFNDIFKKYLNLDNRSLKDFGVLINRLNFLKDNIWEQPTQNYFDLSVLEEIVGLQSILENYPLPESSTVKKITSSEEFQNLSQNLAIKASSKRTIRTPSQVWQSLKEFSHNYIDDSFPFVNSEDNQRGFLYIAGGSVINNLTNIESPKSDVDIFIHKQYDQPQNAFKKSLTNLLKYIDMRSKALNDTIIFVPRKSIIECISVKYGVNFQIIVVNTHNHLENLDNFDFPYDQAVIRAPNKVEVSHNCLFSIMTRRSYKYVIPNEPQTQVKARIIKACLKGFIPFTHKMNIHTFEEYATDPKVIAYLNKGLKYQVPLSPSQFFKELENNRLYKNPKVSRDKYRIYASGKFSYDGSLPEAPRYKNWSLAPIYTINKFIDECERWGMLRGLSSKTFIEYGYNHTKYGFYEQSEYNEITRLVTEPITIKANDLDIKGLFQDSTPKVHHIKTIGYGYTLLKDISFNNIKFRAKFKVSDCFYVSNRCHYHCQEIYQTELCPNVDKECENDYRVTIKNAHQLSSKLMEFDDCLEQWIKVQIPEAKTINSIKHKLEKHNQLNDNSPYRHSFLISKEDFVTLSEKIKNPFGNGDEELFVEISLGKVTYLKTANEVFIKYHLSLHNKPSLVETH